MIWSKLTTAYWNNKLPNAFLLVNADETTLALAKQWEQFLLCENPQLAKPCGTCRACFLYLQNTHPDCCHKIEETLVIETIRDITEYLQQTIHQGKKRIITLGWVDNLTMGAANALLKTLEEPPQDTYFLLLAKKVGGVLPTIKSRCSTVVLPAKSNEKRELSPILLKEFVDGTLGQACTQDPQQALYLFYYWICDCVRIYFNAPTEFIYTNTQQTMLQQKINTMVIHNLLIFLERINEALETLVSPGINKALLLESLLSQWQQMNTRPI